MSPFDSSSIEWCHLFLVTFFPSTITTEDLDTSESDFFFQTPFIFVARLLYVQSPWLVPPIVGNHTDAVSILDSRSLEIIDINIYVLLLSLSSLHTYY